MRTPVDYQSVANALIADYGLTHEEFARLAEVSEKTVGRWVGSGPANAKGVRRAMTKLRAKPEDYGVPPVLAEAAPPAPSTALDEQARHDLAMMRAELAMMHAELTAIRQHLKIPAPQETHA